MRVRRRDLEDRRRILRVKRERRFELRAGIVVMLFGGIDASERHQRPRIGLVERDGPSRNALGVVLPIRADVQVGQGRQHVQVRRIEIGRFLEIVEGPPTVPELLLRESVVVEYLRGLIAQLQQMLGVLDCNIGTVHLKVLGRVTREVQELDRRQLRLHRARVL